MKQKVLSVLGSLHHSASPPTPDIFCDTERLLLLPQAPMQYLPLLAIASPQTNTPTFVYEPLQALAIQCFEARTWHQPRLYGEGHEVAIPSLLRHSAVQ
jgi:hypothetical protein